MTTTPSYIISNDGKVTGFVDCTDGRASDLRKRGWTVIPAN